jgi:hypothetical protein
MNHSFKGISREKILWHATKNVQPTKSDEGKYVAEDPL